MMEIRTNPTNDLAEQITYLERVAQAARALLQYDRAVSALSEGTDEGALYQAQQLFDASFDHLETALAEWDALLAARAQAGREGTAG